MSRCQAESIITHRIMPLTESHAPALHGTAVTITARATHRIRLPIKVRLRPIRCITGRQYII